MGVVITANGRVSARVSTGARFAAVEVVAVVGAGATGTTEETGDVAAASVVVAAVAVPVTAVAVTSSAVAMLTFRACAAHLFVSCEIALMVSCMFPESHLSISPVLSLR